ncbi:MAG: Cell shape-determining protein MreC [Parcubacteria group bacterium GW2011_GWD2_38_12]|nr:MAG: Cell shape-determining protein MreC [Parcubacteria group bacterium GW2011_GWC2_36_17]KKQ39025.1 MAG: Cell shape-determining protein MreC [Candidatus Moranbacteria bacterium GW2011_GWF2_37_7]KKQ43907.1 MAG: Cell shape-determining protein MreC [Parcubacteria group bacterium GW2011_GWE2_37_8]KKQ52837.1 MAG: Cell shape-determining protein MreC [Parcubacteria group bacterium GW2011_GWD2_38_12]KKQ59040.1 MAG: Cell shape-determining protein MreC [Parcubacteria group bacterium GW2011_GWC1_38_17
MRLFKNKFFIFLLFLIFSFLIIFLNSRKLLGFSNNFLNVFVSSVSKPVWLVSGRFSSLFSFIVDLKNIRSEDFNLKDKNQRLLAENIYLKDLLKEKEILDKAREFHIKDNFDWQIGRVIGMDIQNWSGYVIVDIGSDDGIKIGMPVITQNKLLVGKVIEVEKKFSKISTLLNPSIKVATKTQDSQAFGMLTGDYTKSLLMDFIDKDKVLLLGEPVMTSGKDGFFPAGLVIGELKNFEIKPENLFQTAIIRSELNIYDLDRVLVLTKF